MVDFLFSASEQNGMVCKKFSLNILAYSTDAIYTLEKNMWWTFFYIIFENVLDIHISKNECIVED